MWRTTFLVVIFGSLVLGPAPGQQTDLQPLRRTSDGVAVRDPGVQGNFRGRTAERGQTLEAAPFLRLSKSTADYQLGTGDVIRIEIVGNEALSQPLQSLTITGSGDVTIPFLGAVKAAGRTAAELEIEIQTLLKTRQLIRDPGVLVYINDYQAKPIYLVGQVDNPGEYVMSQQMTLTEAILMAGGMEQSGGADLVSGRYGYLHRRIAEDAPDWRPEPVVNNPEIPRPGREVIKIDLEPLRTGGTLQPDILLRRGDVFVVPMRVVQYFYAVGDLRNPGPSELPGPDARTLRLSQAIAQSGGVNQTAKLSKGLLLRYDSSGKRVERKFDFTAVLRGKQPDFPIVGGDIIFIPGSKVKTLQYGLLGVVPSAAQGRARTTSVMQRQP
jgi:polysaccharide biosynthesis/export protein